MDILQDFLKNPETFIGQPGDRQASGEPLQSTANFEEILNLLACELSHEIALEWPVFYQPLLYKATDRLSEWSSADAKLPGKTVLIQTSSDWNCPGQHKIPQLSMNSLIEGNLLNHSQRRSHQGPNL